jgi:hypothetical protein
MQRTLMIFKLALAGVMFLSSCRSGVTIQKRRYHSGFYFSWSKSGRPAVKAPSLISAVPLGRITASTSSKLSFNEQKGDGIWSCGTKTPVRSFPTADRLVRAKASISKNGAGRSIVIAPAGQNGRGLNVFRARAVTTFAKSHTGNDHEGYSLLWVVVVLLLILWALGFLAGGIALGGLIHVLLVLALILFILWLLHII